MHRAAPFIWVASQPIEASGLKSLFFGCAPRTEGENRWFLFRRQFQVSGPARAAHVNLAVDGRYSLRVNGRFVGRGPIRSAPLFMRTTRHDIAPFLRDGANLIALIIQTPGRSLTNYQRMHGEWAAIFGDGGLYCDGGIETAAGFTPLRSDDAWRAVETDAWDRTTPPSGMGLNFMESLNANAVPNGWDELNFDDSHWPAARIMEAGENAPEELLTGGYTTPFPTLAPAEIGPMHEEDAAPSALIAWRGVTDGEDLPVQSRIFEEAHGPLPIGAVSDADAMGNVCVTTSGSQGVSLLVRFDPLIAAHPFIEIDAKGGEIIDMAAAEGLPGEFDGPLAQDARIVAPADSPMANRHCARYVARPGRQRFEWWNWTSVRWLQATIRNAPNGVQLERIGVRAVRYPATRAGAFACSDKRLTRLWEVGAHTLAQCMQDAWIDCPGREQRQWLGDAAVENQVAHYVFGPSMKALNAKFLRQAAETQRADGLTEVTAVGDMSEVDFRIPEWTLHWIIAAGGHHDMFGAEDLFEELFPALQKALGWFERHRGPRGLLSCVPYWSFTDWAAYRRWGDAGVISGLYWLALQSGARIAAALGYERARVRYSGQAQRIAAGFEHLWDEARGVYVDVADPVTGVQERTVSQHTNALALLCGIASPSRGKRILAWITDPKRLKFTRAEPIEPHGERFDPETDCVLANTFFSHWVLMALNRNLGAAPILQLIRERFGPMIDRGATALWESYEPRASLCHGFSTTPCFQLSAGVLGATSLAPGFARFRFSPDLGDLAWARGLTPTQRGAIDIDLRQESGRMHARIVVPEGLSGETMDGAAWRRIDGPVHLPPGAHTLTFTR